jgi:hypothetical protein
MCVAVLGGSSSNRTTLAVRSQRTNRGRRRRRLTEGKAIAGIGRSVTNDIRTPAYYKQSEMLDVELLDAFAQIEALLRSGRRTAARCVASSWRAESRPSFSTIGRRWRYSAAPLRHDGPVPLARGCIARPARHCCRVGKIGGVGDNHLAELTRASAVGAGPRDISARIQASSSARSFAVSAGPRSSMRAIRVALW